MFKLRKEIIVLKKLNLFGRHVMLLILLVANTLTPLANMMVVTADTIATTRELKIIKDNVDLTADGAQPASLKVNQEATFTIERQESVVQDVDVELPDGISYRA